MSSIVLSSFLIGVWNWKHPDIRSNMNNPLNADVAQVYTLIYVLFAQASNHFVIGPLTSKCGTPNGLHLEQFIDAT